ncbi:MAG TPA: histidine phosphatase family protein, partial [Thermoleophilaceae bacterium]
DGAGSVSAVRRRPEIVLARHGETEWSRDGRHTGRSDIPLTEEGERQARALRPALAGRDFARVLVSPLGRAVETCRLAGLLDHAERTDALLEWDYGDYEGVTTREIRSERPDWVLWRDGCPNGETAADVAVRVDPLIAELRALDGDAALFAHGHLLRVLAARWIELDPEHGASLVLTTGTLSALGWEHEWPALTRWNAPVAG